MHVLTDVNVCVRLWCPVPGLPGWHLFWGDSTAAGGEAGNLCAWAEGGPPASSGGTMVLPLLPGGPPSAHAHRLPTSSPAAVLSPQKRCQPGQPGTGHHNLTHTFTSVSTCMH